MSFWKPVMAFVGTAVLILSTVGTAAADGGIQAFSNRPNKIIVWHNDQAVEQRKLKELSQWHKIQEQYIAGQISLSEYINARAGLKGNQGSTSSAPLMASAQPSAMYLSLTAEMQDCKENCGPAATHEALVYSGQNFLSQDDIAAKEGTGTCTPIGGSGSNNGTCIGPIANVLNQYYLNPPYSNYFSLYHLNHTSASAAYTDYSSLVDATIYGNSTPFIQLLDPRPCNNGDVTTLPGWLGTSSCGYRHFIATRGYSGFYNGSAGSRTIAYADSAWWTWGNKTVDLQAIAYDVYEANGSGGCDPNNNDIVW